MHRYRTRILTATALIGALALSSCFTKSTNDDDVVLGELAASQVAADAAYVQGGVIVTSKRLALSAPAQIQNTERYEEFDPNPVKLTAKEPLSTFSSDVDTTAYSRTRRIIQHNDGLPRTNIVRAEEFINYFDYEYERPASVEKPFEPTIWVSPSPWRDGAHLMQIGVQGYELEQATTPDANIVFLLDVSGSMSAENKLPLVKKSLALMLDEMSERDTISIVVYAGAAGVVLEPTNASKKTKILKALDNLSAGGSTAGGAGLSLAYSLAEENFAKDKVNRIILATDGDFNVGTVDADSLESFVARKRDKGVYLTVLGFGEGNYNDVIAQRLAQNGNGNAAYIDTLNEARKVLVREFRSTVIPIARDLKFQVEFNPAVVAEYRLIGYETRALDAEDFNNDAVDAGDIGSGHAVTALYELALVGSGARQIDPLRYSEQKPPTPSDGEIAFVKLRYKPMGAEESELIEKPVLIADTYETFANAPRDARFAAAVAAFAGKLGDTNPMSYDEILKIAADTKGKDPFGERAEFVEIVRAAKSISDRKGDAL